MKEIVKTSPNFGKRVGYKMCIVDEFHDMKEQLEKEAKAYALEWGDKTDGTYACCKDGYLAGAEPRENQIAELKAYNAKLLNGDIEKHNKIVELESQLTKRAEQIEALNKDKDYFYDALDKQIEATYKVVEELNEAKELIEELASSLSVVGECDEEECELINKAQKFINKPIF